MTFSEAWDKAEYNLRSDSYGAIIEIRFYNEYDGYMYATLEAPRFKKDEEGHKEVVQRAWNTFCKGGSDSRSESITQIKIMDKNLYKSADKRLSA